MSKFPANQAAVVWSAADYVCSISAKDEGELGDFITRLHINSCSRGGGQQSDSANTSDNHLGLVLNGIFTWEDRVLMLPWPSTHIHIPRSVNFSVIILTY